MIVGSSGLYTSRAIRARHLTHGGVGRRGQPCSLQETTTPRPEPRCVDRASLKPGLHALATGARDLDVLRLHTSRYGVIRLRPILASPTTPAPTKAIAEGSGTAVAVTVVSGPVPKPI